MKPNVELWSSRDLPQTHQRSRCSQTEFYQISLQLSVQFLNTTYTAASAASAAVLWHVSMTTQLQDTITHSFWIFVTADSLRELSRSHRVLVTLAFWVPDINTLTYLLTYLLNSLAGWSVSCCHQSSSVKTNPEHKANWTLDELTSYLRYWMSNVNRSTASWPRACLSTTLPRICPHFTHTLLNFSLINVLQQGAFTWSWVSSIIHYLSRCCTIALDRHYHQLAGCCLSVCLSVCQYRYSRIFAVRYYA